MPPIDHRLERLYHHLVRFQSLDPLIGLANLLCGALEGESQEKMPLPIAGLEGGEGPIDPVNEKGKWLAWDWQGSRIKLQLDISHNSGWDFNTGKLHISVDNVEVAVLDVSQRLTAEYDAWTFSDVSAFRAGPWMSQLNDLAGQLRIAKSQSRRDSERSLYEDKARNIELE